MPKPLAVEDLPPFQYCMYNKNQMIYASSHRFFQHYSIIPDTPIHCGDPVINHTLVASLENCASSPPATSLAGYRRILCESLFSTP